MIQDFLLSLSHGRNLSSGICMVSKSELVMCK